MAARIEYSEKYQDDCFEYRYARYCLFSHARMYA